LQPAIERRPEEEQKKNRRIKMGLTRREIDANYDKVSKEAVREAKEMLAKEKPGSPRAQHLQETLTWYQKYGR
jgi:hypothetical protein